MPFEGEKFGEISTSPTEEKEEAIEEKPEELEKSLEGLIGPERLEKIKERTGENLGVSVNTEFLVSDFEDKEFIGKTAKEAKILAKEKMLELPEKKRQIWEEHLKKSDEEIEELLKENEEGFIEFEKVREKSLEWFIDSDIKNIRLNPWHPESWLRWDNVEEEKSGEFKINPMAEEIIDRLVQAGKNINLVLAFANKDYFGKENQYNIPSSEEEIEAYKRFCGFMVEHFKGKINRFEIGSEPNVKPGGLGEKFKEGFPSNSSPELYGKLAAIIAEAIKNKNPKAEIIFGNVALFDPEFIGIGLEEVKEYEENLRKEGKINPHQHLIDYVGFHPYRKSPEEPSSAVENGVGQFSKEQDKAARKKYGYKTYDDQIEIYKKIAGNYSSNVRLINTEVGWHTEASEEHSWVPDEKTQAEYTLKAAAIDASHGISTNFFELFEKAVGEKNSLIDKEGKPRESLKNLEKFNRYLEFLKRKETPEKWVEKHKEQFKEKTRSIWQEIYKKVFPERTLNIEFLSPEAFAEYCQDKELPLPSDKTAGETFFNRFQEGNVMNYPINEKIILEFLKKRVEFSKEREEQKTNDEIAEKLIINLGTHEIRHDLHPYDRPEEKLIEPLTLDSLSGYKELQEEYKKKLKKLQEEGTFTEGIPEECDCMIVDETAGNLWERGIKDIDLISKIVRYGDGSKIGEISNLLKDKELDTPQLLEKIKEIF